MDEIAEGMKRVYEEEEAFHRAKSANLAASATMCRWLRRAEDTFGKDHDITKHYESVLGTLIEQHELILDGDKKAMVEAGKTAIEINKKYGGIREKEISREDHIKRFHKPDGPT